MAKCGHPHCFNEKRAMDRPNSDFLMSTELECLTATPSVPDQVPHAMDALLRYVSEFAPTLPGPGGVFNPYGRIYVDCGGHLELAMVESHCPYVLALIVERQQRVIARARRRLATRGIELLLANNNNSGLLHSGCPVWGSHENYLVDRHPTEFTDLILPFLVTRLYGGAGAIEFPSGSFLASSRATCMTTATGGDTTDRRAIHSTCREEHHMGPRPKRFRYNGILGDGHRSQFNLALQFGATALALKAIVHDRRLHRELARLGRFAGDSWVPFLKQLNVLQRPGRELQVDRAVVRVQRVYLDAARRYVKRLEVAPPWVWKLLQDWEETLDAVERLDRGWLSARLDAFAKYEVYSSVLEDEGLSWADLPQHRHLFHELTLLDHSYHNFCDPLSVFTLLEQDGLLTHRVGPIVPPGEESDPFVPECSTRARPRARFIKDHAGDRRYLVDWSHVWDRKDDRIASLEDPFAAQLGEWTDRSTATRHSGDDSLPRTLRQLRDLLEM